MRERIARALAEDTDRTMPRFVQQKWEGLTGLARAAMYRRADAVLEAMRTPTLHMKQEAGDAVIVGCCNLQLRDAEKVWNIMIDAAAKER